MEPKMIENGIPLDLETKTRLAATLHRLPDRYANALRLRFVEDVPAEECARRMGLAPPEFDGVLHQASRVVEREWSKR
jgi:DNA-directed RNA polymerase specialized sigma24 family protein